MQNGSAQTGIVLVAKGDDFAVQFADEDVTNRIFVSCFFKVTVKMTWRAFCHCRRKDGIFTEAIG